MESIIGRIVSVVTNMFIRRGVRSAIDHTMGSGKSGRGDDRDADRDARRAAKQARKATKIAGKF